MLPRFEITSKSHSGEFWRYQKEFSQDAHIGQLCNRGFWHHRDDIFVDNKAGHGIQNKAYSAITSVTSFLSIGDEGQAIGEAIPDLSDMVLDGVHLEYEEPFECPYCRTIRCVSDRGEWK